MTFACIKAKDFVAGNDMQFTINQVDLGWFDDEEQPMTSVFLNYMGDAIPKQKTAKLSPREELILTSLGCAIDKHGIEPNEEIKAIFKDDFDSFLGTQKVILINDWRPIAYKSINADASTEDAKRVALNRCRTKLLKLGYVVEYDGFIWRKHK